MALIGFVLDRLAPGGPGSYTLGDFRWAMSVQFLFWGFGGLQVWRYRHKTLGYLQRTNPEALAALRRGESALPGISQPTPR